LKISPSPVTGEAVKKHIRELWHLTQERIIAYLIEEEQRKKKDQKTLETVKKH
jgi:hypothetical protein